MEAIVQLSGVSKRYGEGELTVQALQEVDLTLERGAFAAVVGPSGSGKTTLLNMLGALDRPDAGQVHVEGREITRLSRAAQARLRLQRIGFVFQAYNMLPVLTAYENAEYVLLLQGVRAPERRRRVLALLERVGLAGLADRFPHQLSGGQQQRVAVARAIASEPALVLADEPTANLDSRTGAALIDLMVELNQEKGTTFLFSTHDQHVMSRARQLLLLTDGRITYAGNYAGYALLP